MTPDDSIAPVHKLSIIIPVYQGAQTLRPLLAEIDAFTQPFQTALGHQAVVSEVLLVDDHGPDGSGDTIRGLAEELDYVRPVWLSRNFGQHAATIAGMASSGGDWIVTMDEDGQHNPSDIGSLLDAALVDQASLVYAEATNAAPHGLFRNATSKVAKWIVKAMMGDASATRYQSFRLMLGEVGRSAAAYAGAGVYLDVALGWVAGDVTTAPVTLRSEGERTSGYSPRRLLSHFWRMVLSSGTRGLRLVSILGALTAVTGIAFAIILAASRLTGGTVPTGWTSTMVVILLTSGLILFSMGVVAEYIGVAVNAAIGKPPYLIVSDPQYGPLGRTRKLHDGTTDRGADSR
ncbi:Glycosyltransferase involved in cell wall bisynthesis [Sanguibacter gelidistatuariae]|uniref:Glycosyltransferase involved in cell wall bisynthesis n=1 Tax=Sanguibacter gelidistatuariae TaxID=1814289 RepID=A0A1G6XVA1_9MICO|nr:glycosyltransferase [Sanguibacter gelidistatuariae]SDD81942.1 Glycosyltransferase involved in cell wall bisynthesis [Sanguibacter gelidistatuariae]